ncbi:sulfotransferase [Aurantiacibacter poecillastricola]|uniref:sulfotransferase n=1 Tax=Aurantiacibacter poecillastricola TaxID=3064385 RepID=UPI00273FF38A|nr:sulfotransferase domain-containing protein [Aurantiacibacter sp. 219JJ12-13]MDP5259995.1 sulfotransferase [Aurantiacibacter sp. 219JJ12-13]
MKQDTTPLPAFIVIGAAKAATTWIANQLRARPDIFIPGPEPHYFSSEFDRGEAWYRAWFADAQPGQIVSEKSADYLAHPDAPHRMAAMLPGIRLLVQLRNPVERAYSDYCMYFRRGTVDGDIAKWLGSPDHDYPRFLMDGLYHQHIQRFLEYYPREMMDIVFYEDIRSQPDAVLDRVYRFLDLPELEEEISLVERANVKNAPMLPLALRKGLAPAKGMVAPLRSKPWFKAIHGALSKEVSYPPLPDGLRQRLIDFYAHDVEQLEKLVGRDLSSWRQG